MAAAWAIWISKSSGNHPPLPPPAWWSVWGAGSQEERASGGKACFLEKSGKKLLVVLTSPWPRTLSPEGQKSWCFLSKEHRFLPLVFARPVSPSHRGSDSFLKKRSKGLYGSRPGLPGNAEPGPQSFFCFFLSKKDDSFPLL
jgi:hypothetical protein